MRKVYSKSIKWWNFWSFDNTTGQKTRRAQKEVEAVTGLSLKLYKGEHFAIAGHSGSGKTSIINMLSRLSSYTSEEAYIYGVPLTEGSSGCLTLNMIFFCYVWTSSFDYIYIFPLFHLHIKYIL